MERVLASPLLQNYLVGRNHTVFLVAGERMKNRKRGRVESLLSCLKGPLRPQS